MLLINIFFWIVLILATVSFSVLLHQYEKSKQKAIAELEKLYKYEINGSRTVRHQYRKYESAETYLPSQTKLMTKLYIQKDKTVMKVQNTTHRFRKIYVSDANPYTIKLDYAI